MGCTCGKQAIVNEPGQDIRDVYRIGKLLGSGAFGQVRECIRRQDGELLAVKIMERKSRETGHWSNENMFRREVELLGILDSPHIVRYVDFYEDRHFLYAVIERCEGGELFDQVVKCKRFSEEDASYLCRQMLQALAYVHSINIVHRDVKAENFLFKDKDVNSQLKLIDFGMSARLVSQSARLTEVCGSPHYLSPELVRRRYNTKADMWALGVIIYLMVYGRYPFDGKGTAAIVKQILKVEIDFDDPKVKPSPACISMMKGLLHRDPEKRFSAAEALQHEWVRDTEEFRQRRQRALDTAAGLDLTDCIRSAHRKLTLTRKSGLSKEVEARLNHLLEKIEQEWAQGRACGVRVSALNRPPQIKPEFSRHDKRMNTTPSRYQGGSLADLQALRRAMELETNQRQSTEQMAPDLSAFNTSVDSQGDMDLEAIGRRRYGSSRHESSNQRQSTHRNSTQGEPSTPGHDSSGMLLYGDSHGPPETMAGKAEWFDDKGNIDWAAAEKSLVDGQQESHRSPTNDLFTRSERRAVTVTVQQKDTSQALSQLALEFERNFSTASSKDRDDRRTLPSSESASVPAMA